MSSPALGKCNEGHVSENSIYPNKMLACVQRPELIPEVEADAKCPKRVPAGVRELLVKLGDLRSSVSQAVLEVLGRHGKRENITPEYRNQRIHRVCVGRPHQRKVVDLRNLNVFWVNGQGEHQARGWWEDKRVKRRPPLRSAKTAESRNKKKPSQARPKSSYKKKPSHAWPRRSKMDGGRGGLASTC